MIRKILIISTIFLTILGISCQDDDIEKGEVFIYELSHGKSYIRGSYSVMKDTKIMYSKEYEVYSDTVGSEFLYFSIHHLDSLTLLKENVIFNLVDSKKYFTKNQEIDIRKYHHERRNSDDIEAYVYYSYDVGLIGYFDCSTYRLDYIEYKETSEIKEQILKDIAESLSLMENDLQ